MATLKLEIVTPEGKTCSEDVDMVTLPGVEGEMGIYPQHVPLLTQIAPGEITVRRGGQEYFLAVGPGFVEITGERVSVLTDMAIRADDLDDAKAEAARAAAEKRLKERLGEGDAAAVNAAILRSVEALKGRRRRGK
ncbi:MAG: ATP synthase F1 subunit epsilon [Verrucomicrobia bacterium]|nr:ATP synthase F1 subunit epsilon [Verrucomicrobiota bacterium]